MKHRQTNFPRGVLDKMAAAAPAHISREQAHRPWSARYAAPNILHYFSLPSHPPEGRPKRAKGEPAAELPDPPTIDLATYPSRFRPWKLNAAEKEAIRAQAGQGKSFAALAAEYKVSRQAVWSVVNGPTVKFAAERREELRRRWLAGENQFDLAREFHITTRTLHKLVLREGGSNSSSAREA